MLVGRLKIQIITTKIRTDLNLSLEVGHHNVSEIKHSRKKKQQFFLLFGTTPSLINSFQPLNIQQRKIFV